MHCFPGLMRCLPGLIEVGGAVEDGEQRPCTLGCRLSSVMTSLLTSDDVIVLVVDTDIADMSMERSGEGVRHN